MSDASVQSTGE